MFLKTLLLWVVIAHCGSTPTVVERKSYAGYKMYRVPTAVPHQIAELHDFLRRSNLDVIDLGVHQNGTDYVVPPNEIRNFEWSVRSLGFKLEVIHQDMEEVFAMERRTNTASDKLTWDNYYDIDIMHKYLKEMAAAFPSLAKVVQGGVSYEKRPILGLRINNPNHEYTYNASKPAIVIEAGIHAREWITPAAATYLIQQLLTSQDSRVVQMRDTLDWHIFPSINPDGYQYSRNHDRMWRKTRSLSANGCYGADPNRNWDHNWGVHGVAINPCSYEVYPGTQPFSEVETRTFAEYVASVQNLQGYIGLHSYAALILLPYSDTVEHCDNYDDLVLMGKHSIEYGAKVNGIRYRGVGTAGEMLYMVSGGSMDWVREKLGTDVVLTYEMRGQSFEWPPQRIREQGEELVHMLRGVVDKARQLGYF